MIEMSFIEMIIRNESENKEAARLSMKDIYILTGKQKKILWDKAKKNIMCL